MDIDLHKYQFGQFAQDYTKYRRPYNPELFNLIFSVGGNGGKKILDIACGTGKSTENLLGEGNDVFGCDIDPQMIKEAKSQALKKGLGITYIVAPAEKLPYGDNEFDIVTVGTAFHWFVNETAIQEIERVLKPSGVFFAFWTWTTKEIPKEDSIPSDFLAQFNWQKVPRKLRHLDYISEFLKENGFVEIKTDHFPDINSYTVEEYVGLMKTASAYGVLSQEDKQKFDTGLTRILTQQLGTREKFVLDDELQVCYGFKK